MVSQDNDAIALFKRIDKRTRDEQKAATRRAQEVMSKLKEFDRNLTILTHVVEQNIAPQNQRLWNQFAAAALTSRPAAHAAETANAMLAEWVKRWGE